MKYDPLKEFAWRFIAVWVVLAGIIAASELIIVVCLLPIGLWMIATGNIIHPLEAPMWVLVVNVIWELCCVASFFAAVSMAEEP